MRCFISIELDSVIKKNIENFIQKNKLKEHFSDTRWVKPDNLHITLAFLGETPEDKIVSVKKILSTISKRHTHFSLKFTKLGFFPSIKKPRVIWIGIEDNPKLLMLKNDIDSVLSKEGIIYDKKSFLPHLTIGRIKTPGTLQPEAIQYLHINTISSVREIHLMKSELSQQGANYTCLYKAILQNTV